MAYLVSPDGQSTYWHNGIESSAQGFTFSCPKCRSKHTAYSANCQCWSCQDCGLMFDTPEALLIYDQEPLPMRVYNLGTQEIVPMRFPGDVVPGDVWLLSVPAPKTCDHCHRWITVYDQHTVHVTSRMGLASAKSYHLSCIPSDPLIEAVAELI